MAVRTVRVVHKTDAFEEQVRALAAAGDLAGLNRMKALLTDRVQIALIEATIGNLDQYVTGLA